jgi:hypothetical protein
MYESELRDLLAKDISLIEPGLTLLEKETFVPNELGTRSFIDLYARDLENHHVLIELKRNDAAAREAIHEILKYVEGVKRYFGAKDDEVRVIVASMEWNELLVPFSRLVADTPIAVIGKLLVVDSATGAISSTQIAPLPVTTGRVFSPWCEVHWHEDKRRMLDGLESIRASCKQKNIDDYVIVSLRPPTPWISEHEAKMYSAICQMASRETDQSRLPRYEFVVYFATRLLSKDEYIALLSAEPDQLNDLPDLLADLDSEELLHTLHERFAQIGPRKIYDHFEIGYPAKFSSFINHDFEVIDVFREGAFARNRLLSDETILGELEGKDGSTGQRYKRTFLLSNKAHLAGVRRDLSACLEQNQVWGRHIQRALDECLEQHPSASVEISIFNPQTGISTLLHSLTNKDGFLYMPTYHLRVDDSEPKKMYFGALRAASEPLSFRQLLRKYYEGDLGALLGTLSWGGRETRDSEIVRDLGLAYRSFRCDIVNTDRQFFVLENDQWKRSQPSDVISLFVQYAEKNKKLVRKIIVQLNSRLTQGVFDGSCAERLLKAQIELEGKDPRSATFTPRVMECENCGAPFHEEPYLICGLMVEANQWGHMCVNCHYKIGAPIGWDTARVYASNKREWRQVAGFRVVIAR